MEKFLVAFEMNFKDLVGFFWPLKNGEGWL